jgi:MFS family permease
MNRSDALPGVPPAARQPRPIQAAVLLVTSGLTTLATAVLGPSLPKMQAHFAAVPSVDYIVPLTMTSPMLMMALLSIVAGGLADRFGRKRLLVGSTALYALFGTAPLWLYSLQTIFASRILLGVTEAFLMTISTTMIGDYYEGVRRQRYIVLQTTVASGSALVLNLLGGAMGELGWRAPYVVYVVSVPLALLMARFLWEPEPRRPDTTEPAGEGAEKPLQLGLLAGICGVGFFVGLVFLIVPVHLAYLFEALGVHSSAAIGVAAGLNSLGVVTGTLCFGWLVGPRLPVSGQLALAAALTGLGFVGMGFADSYAALTAAAIANGFGAGLLLPTAVSWNLRDLPFAHRGFGVGAFQSCQFFGMFANPFVVVSLERSLGTRAAAVVVVGLALIAAAFGALIVSVRGRRAAQSAARLG